MIALKTTPWAVRVVTARSWPLSAIKMTASPLISPPIEKEPAGYDGFEGALLEPPLLLVVLLVLLLGEFTVDPGELLTFVDPGELTLMIPELLTDVSLLTMVVLLLLVTELSDASTEIVFPELIFPELVFPELVLVMVFPELVFPELVFVTELSIIVLLLLMLLLVTELSILVVLLNGPELTVFPEILLPEFMLLVVVEFML